MLWRASATDKRRRRQAALAEIEPMPALIPSAMKVCKSSRGLQRATSADDAQALIGVIADRTAPAMATSARQQGQHGAGAARPPLGRERSRVVSVIFSTDFHGRHAMQLEHRASSSSSSASPRQRRQQRGLLRSAPAPRTPAGTAAFRRPRDFGEPNAAPPSMSAAWAASLRLRLPRHDLLRPRPSMTAGSQASAVGLTSSPS